MMDGFGGSNKNIGIGCADGRRGKAQIHTTPGSSNMWDIAEEELMERISESAKATVGFFSSDGRAITFVNVLRNMSVSCDCQGIHAASAVPPNVGILASTDMLAADQASVDMVFAMKPEENHEPDRAHANTAWHEAAFIHEGARRRQQPLCADRPRSRWQAHERRGGSRESYAV
ncbi:DUF362 domain-containing protein [Atopobium sp. oral taxon 416]|uniref:DUF362 domain-containing protein n=1 Tax=Atopobium sp. oral taxon 416 TaxID=712157 RepID=UPI001BAA5FD9|nr:DUF362 domain-containing protein [Atopobium sp. oral taxon 416]QUC04236.1 DUF362 domain-containing protein [Atopobium sp. oral taxon 416]